VIIGAGSFIEKANGFAYFERAIRKKMLREIQSQVSAAPQPRSWRIADR